MWRLESSLFCKEQDVFLDKRDAPELLLAQAEEEMKAMCARNRARAEQAFAQRDELQRTVEEMAQRLQTLERDTQEAEAWGLLERAGRLHAEGEAQRAEYDVSRARLEKANETAELVREALAREQERIREKTAEAEAVRGRLRNREARAQMRESARA